MNPRTDPLIFALKHLHVAWDADLETDADKLRRDVSLKQGNVAVPPASGEVVKMFFDNSPAGDLPNEMERRMLELTHPGWPEDLCLVWQGIVYFGAGDVAGAGACARHGLERDPQCLLARQLVSLLCAPRPVRCEFGRDPRDAPDVPEIVAPLAG